MNQCQDMSELRRRVVAAVESGITHNEVARRFGISRQTVGTWVRSYRRAGDEAFLPAPRGRRRGEQLALTPTAQATTIRTISRHVPDQLGLRYRLWTRQAVGELINREFRITLGNTTVGNYLVRWGIRVDNHALHHLRMTHASQLVPGDAVWQSTAEMLWVTWQQPRTEEVAGRTALFAVSNRGATYFQFTDDHGDAGQVGAFLRRLTEQVGRPANVVVGWQPSGDDGDLRSWLAANADRTTVRFTPC